MQLTTVEAAGLSAVRRCVSLIANAIAGREWQEWEGTRRLDPSRLVLRPAAGMTRRDWSWRVVTSIALFDLAYAYMVGGVDDEGVPGSLVPIPNMAIAPAGFVDPWDIVPPAQYRLSGMAGTISGEAMLRIRGPIWPGVPAHLQGILATARATLGMSYSADAYAARYWAAGGAPTTVITTDQDLTNPQAETMASRWMDRRAKGPDYPAVFGKGGHADPYGADPTTESAVEARRDMVTEVARHFGVPAHLALAQTPAGSGMTYTNVESEGLSLDRYTLGGYVDPIQDAISGLLPGGWQGGRRMVIDMGPLTRADQETRFRSWAFALGGTSGQPGFMTVDEVREAEGLPPDTSGDLAPGRFPAPDAAPAPADAPPAPAEVPA
jgi:HK97 family phage portal protein